jgi:hypothetical protein
MFFKLISGYRRLNASLMKIQNHYLKQFHCDIHSKKYNIKITHPTKIDISLYLELLVRYLGHIFLKLTSWGRVLLEKVIVAQLLKSKSRYDRRSVGQ